MTAGLTVEEDKEGNVHLVGDEPEQDDEEEVDEAKAAYDQRIDEAQQRLQEWIKGQDD